ncbi:Trigger factor [bioreactor metagenome]|uniref:Trigger factor n=1 Tax=bioreactor metagenome TaxID=1076179 RepID=A0A645AB57_9ZZZZ
MKLHEVKTKELPVLDDEFAKDVSEYDTLAELRESIVKNKQEQADKQDDLAVENALVDQVVAGMTADVPAAMIETQVDNMVHDFEYRLEQQGLKLDMYLQYTGSTMEKFRESFNEQAEKQVKVRLALEKVTELENITASEEDLENEIKRIADAYKMEVEKVRGLVPVEDVKKDLAVNKAIDFIKTNAKVTEKKASKEDEAKDKED